MTICLADLREKRESVADRQDRQRSTIEDDPEEVALEPTQGLFLAMIKIMLFICNSQDFLFYSSHKNYWHKKKTKYYFLASSLRTLRNLPKHDDNGDYNLRY